MALRYKITKSTLFPSDNDVLRDHRIQESFETGWQFTIRKKASDAPIMGTIDNAFSSVTINKFEGRDDNVTLEPIYGNIGGERGRAALGDLRKQLDDENKDAVGYLVKGSNRSKLPIREVFMPGMSFAGVDNALLGDDIQVPESWKQELNASQVKAVEMALSKKSSVICDPAGTGKSATIARLAHRLHELKRSGNVEKTIVTAPTNVAVDQVRKRVSDIWTKHMTKEESSATFMRVYSESAIVSQYVDKEVDKYIDPEHIDAQRLAIAKWDTLKWISFLAGRQELIEYSAIVDDKKAKEYMRARQDLTGMVMAKAKVVFCTLDSIRTRALYHKESVKDKDGKSIDAVIAWPATTYIVDEAGCAKELQALLRMTSFSQTIKRIVFAGDHKQLPAFVLSEEAKKLWSKFLSRIEKGVLDLQQR